MEVLKKRMTQVFKSLFGGQKPIRDAQIKTTCFGLRVNENIFFAKPLRFGDVYYSSKCPAEADTSIF